MMRRKLTALGLAGALLAGVLTGCQGGTKAPESTTSTAAEAEQKKEEGTQASKSEKPIKVGLVLSTGGLGDKNFNDMTYAGVVRAQEELGIEFDYVEPSSVSDFLSMDMMFAESGEYDLIITIGADQIEAITEISTEYPEQKISLIDATLELDNVSAVPTKWAEQTFFSGVLAGLGTKSAMEKANEENVIGVILGKEFPTLKEGATSFIAGARYVNPDIEVLEATVGEFNDPGKGKEIALSMYNRGADFIQHIAGASGIGVFGAAKEANRYAIGVGANQNGENPDYVVATSIRNVDEIVYKEIKAFCEGTWTPGVHMSGLKEGAVGYSLEGSNVEVPEEIIQTIEKIKEDVLSGKLVLCDKYEELDAWAAANQYTK